MPDWDEDSPELRENLRAVLRGIQDEARQRLPLDLNVIRGWHHNTMKGLTVSKPAWVGRFRGERGLESLEVLIGKHGGTPAGRVASEVGDFGSRLHVIIARMDRTIAHNADLTTDQLAAVLHACAWAHSEWVRIHPFANGNGRTARLLANAIALRYGLPPFIRLRPRPNYGYAQAADASMRGNHRPLTTAFRKMLNAYLSGT